MYLKLPISEVESYRLFGGDGIYFTVCSPYCVQVLSRFVSWRVHYVEVDVLHCWISRVYCLGVQNTIQWQAFEHNTLGCWTWMWTTHGTCFSYYARKVLGLPVLMMGLRCYEDPWQLDQPLNKAEYLNSSSIGGVENPQFVMILVHRIAMNNKNVSHVNYLNKPQLAMSHVVSPATRFFCNRCWCNNLVVHRELLLVDTGGIRGWEYDLRIRLYLHQEWLLMAN